MTGEGGLLQQLTKRVLKSALEDEITDHVGYGKHDVMGRNSSNSRTGNRTKTVLTDVGPVEVKVPRDVAGTFEPSRMRTHRQIPGGRAGGPPQGRGTTRPGHRMPAGSAHRPWVRPWWVTPGAGNALVGPVGAYCAGFELRGQLVAVERVLVIPRGDRIH